MSYHFDVSPRFTPGSPAYLGKDAGTALRLAGAERVAFDDVLRGYCEGDGELAARGIGGIVLLCVDVAKGRLVLDLLSRRESFWPDVADCPSCGERKVSTEAGRLLPHGWRFRPVRHPCEGSGTDVGVDIGGSCAPENMARSRKLALAAKRAGLRPGQDYLGEFAATGDVTLHPMRPHDAGDATGGAA